MPLNCPKCGEEIKAPNVDLATRLAKCRVCNEVFGFDVPATPAEKDAAPARVPQPENLRVTDDGYTRRIVLRWFQPALLFALCFCIAWDSFLVVWYWMALVGPAADGPGPARVLTVVFPIAHVAIGVGLTYATLAGLLNRTVVVVSGGRLVVVHGPVPCGGNRNLDAAEIAALYCELEPPGNRRGFHLSNGPPSPTYRLMAATADGRAVAVLRGIEAKAAALFYEQQLEDWLGLPPKPVPGEIDRG